MGCVEKRRFKSGVKRRIEYRDNGRKMRTAWADWTAKEAEAERRRIEAELRIKQDRQRVGPLGMRKIRQLTITEFFEYFKDERMNEVRVGDLSMETLKRLVYAFELFMVMMPDKNMNEVSEDDIELFKEERSKVISARGANKDLINLKTVLNWGKKKKVIEWNVWEEVELHKVSKKLPKFYLPDELDKIESFLPEGLRKFAFQVTKFTAVRRTELTRIRWKNFRGNFEYLILERTKKDIERSVPINYRLQEILIQRKREIKAGAEELIVPVGPDTITKWFRSAEKEAGVYMRGNAVHILRHSVGVYLASKGSALNEIAQILGHQTLEMSKHYAQITKVREMETIQSLYEKEGNAPFLPPRRKEEEWEDTLN